MPSNAAFHPTIETVGFQTAFSVKKKDNRLCETPCSKGNGEDRDSYTLAETIYTSTYFSSCMIIPVFYPTCRLPVLLDEEKNRPGQVRLIKTGNVYRLEWNIEQGVQKRVET
jgi:hypothetical protein